MKCDEIRTLLNPYVDRELSSAEAEQVKRHIEGCPACAKEVAELKKVKEILHKMSVLTAPAGLLEGVRRNLERPNQDILQGRNTFSRYRWLTLSLVSAAAVILVVFTVMIQYRKRDMPAPVLVSEKAKANLEMSVMAKTETADAIQAQPMLFTQQINISTRNVDNAVAKVYAVASTQTPDRRLQAEYRKMQAVQEELLARARAEPQVQDETQTISNVVAPLREKKVTQSRQLGQVVKISIPLSQKDAFIRQLQGTIPDKMVMSEVQAVSPAIQQEILKEGYLTDAGKAMTEGEKTQDENEKSNQGTSTYDTVGKGGGRGFDGKQAEVNKDKEGKPKDEVTKEKSKITTGSAKKAEQSTPPPPASPSPSALPPPQPAGGFGQTQTEDNKEVRQDKDMEKPGLVGDIKNDVSQASQPMRVEPEAMIEFIIVIEPFEK